jgi:hypothetical protein
LQFHRHWAMPNRHTFKIPAVRDLLKRLTCDCLAIVDPMCGSSEIAHYRNDLESGGVEAREFLRGLIRSRVVADCVIYDPPYSPTQLARVYRRSGLVADRSGSQNSKLNAEVKDMLDRLLLPSGLAICCGWNSSGMGKCRIYEIEELHLICHGGSHNDTIVTVERKLEI